MSNHQLCVLPVRNNTPGLTLTQGENGSFSHQGSLAMDFAYPTLNVAYYAPADMICRFIDIPNAGIFWESVSDVKRADGSIGKIVCLFVHDPFLSNYSVGQIIHKDQIIGHTGVAGNASGDHLHIEVSTVSWADNSNTYIQNTQGVWELRQSTNVWRVMSVCDNISGSQISIINGWVYPWICILDWDDGDIWDGLPPNDNDGHDVSKFIILRILGVL